MVFVFYLQDGSIGITERVKRARYPRILLRGGDGERGRWRELEIEERSLTNELRKLRESG
jgi:hypothetical protein